MAWLEVGAVITNFYKVCLVHEIWAQASPSQIVLQNSQSPRRGRSAMALRAPPWRHGSWKERLRPPTSSTTSTSGSIPTALAPAVLPQAPVDTGHWGVRAGHMNELYRGGGQVIPALRRPYHRISVPQLGIIPYGSHGLVLWPLCQAHMPAAQVPAPEWITALGPTRSLFPPLTLQAG